MHRCTKQSKGPALAALESVQCVLITHRVELIPRFELRKRWLFWQAWLVKALFQSAVCFTVELVPPRLLEDLVNKLLAEPWDTGDNLALLCCCIACSRYLPIATSLGQGIPAGPLQETLC